MAPPPPPERPVTEAFITDSVRYESSHMTAYNFVYPSTDPYGHPVMLSAAITVGDAVSRQQPAAALMLYNHFTSYRADQCPTRGDLMAQKIISRGPLITVSPDYYGFGSSDHRHQAYCISAINAQAAVDALLAAQTLLDGLGYHWDDRLIVAGYSQGAQTAMGVVRLVTEHYPDIHITATYAGAGSYDIPATYRSFIQGIVTDMPSTVISVLLAYNEFFSLGIPYSELFIEPVLSHIEDWFFSKRYSREEIDAMIGTNSLSGFLTPALNDLASELSHRVVEALEQDNLCHGWTPRSNERIYLFHNTQDNTVPVVNTEHLYQFLVDHGATDVTLDVADYGTPGHTTGAVTFINNSIADISQLLGIEPWTLF